MYSDDEKIDEEKMKEVHTKYEAQEKKSDAKCRVIWKLKEQIIFKVGFYRAVNYFV